MIGMALLAGAAFAAAGSLYPVASPRVTPSRCMESAFPVWTSPAPVSRSGGVERKVYVADEDRGTVSVIDAVSRQWIKAIPLAYAHGDMAMGFAPHNVQSAPDGRTVWVTAPPPMKMVGCDDGDSLPPPPMPPGMGEEVVIIDPLADTIITRVMLLPSADDTMLHVAHVVLDAGSRYAYVSANAADEVIRIDARTFEEERRYDLGAGRGPHGMRFCGEKLVVANMTGKSLSIIDPAAGPETEVPLGGLAVQIACTADGGAALATLYDTREVVRYDLKTGALQRIFLGEESRGPIQLYLATDDRHVYVADQGMLFGRPASNKLYEVDLERGVVSRSVRVGRAPHGVVVSADGKHAYVTNVWDANISVVDLDAMKEVGTVGVGESPNGITYWNGIGTETSATR